MSLDSYRQGVLRATILGQATGKVQASLEWHAAGELPTDHESFITNTNFNYQFPVTDKLLAIRIALNNCHADTRFNVASGYIRALHPIPA